MDKHNEAVQKFIEVLEKNEGFSDEQVRSAAAIIMMFRKIKDGLVDDVPAEQLNDIAAKLTVGMWSNHF